ncbi:MAG: hypothetical protein JO019_01840 [Candidatus Kaiserbacteria bacterium]|nr:hypothetical protein [Candidatus Kaiserbacteria bacterium]
MADTIITNSPERGTNNGDSSAGWAVAVIILLIIVAAGGYYILRHRGAVQNPAANIQVNIPNPTNTVPSGTATGSATQ